MKVAIVQSVACSNIGINLYWLKKYISHAAKQGAKVVILPDYCVLLSNNSHAYSAARELIGSGRIQNRLSLLAEKYNVWLVASGIPIVSYDQKIGSYYSATLVYNNQGKLAQQYNHVHALLPNGDSLLLDDINQVSLGSRIAYIDTPWARIGLLATADMFDMRMCAYLQQKGVQMIAYSAFISDTKRYHAWIALLQSRAFEMQIPILFANQSGYHNDLDIYSCGNSAIINEQGEIESSLAKLPAVLIDDISINPIQKTYVYSPLILKYKN